MSKKKLKELEFQTTKLFNKYGFKTPRRILPNIIFDWMTPMYCFKVRMRTIISEILYNRNFEVLNDGSILTSSGKPSILLDSSNIELVKQIKKDLLSKGIDLEKI